LRIFIPHHYAVQSRFQVPETIIMADVQFILNPEISDFSWERNVSDLRSWILRRTILRLRAYGTTALRYYVAHSGFLGFTALNLTVFRTAFDLFTLQSGGNEWIANRNT
jgi:hypothetical protein